MDISGIAGTAVSILQAQNNHNKEVTEAMKRHDVSMKLAVAQHEKDMKVAKQAYLMSAFTSLEQHFQVDISLALAVQYINSPVLII